MFCSAQMNVQFYANRELTEKENMLHIHKFLGPIKLFDFA